MFPSGSLHSFPSLARVSLSDVDWTRHRSVNISEHQFIWVGGWVGWLVGFVWPVVFGYTLGLELSSLWLLAVQTVSGMTSLSWSGPQVGPAIG